MILHRYVLTLDIADFTEAFAKRKGIACGRIGRSAVNECDHRHRRLLRARCERPACGRAAERG
jgi:hypothetical protein